MHKKIPDNWYETFFSGINCELWEKATTPEQTEKEVYFLIETLDLQPGASVLDIPSGTGRHSISLALKGFKATAVDISEEFITKLRKKVKEQKLAVQVIHKNILDLSLSTTFDAAFCMGNSFGYFNHEGIKSFVAKVSASLKPKGRFLINSAMVAESILPNLQAHKTFTIGDLTMEVKNSYDVRDSYMISHLRYVKIKKIENHSFKHYVFTLAEIKRLLKDFNLKTIAVYNSIDRTPYKFGDQQMYLVGEKKIVNCE